MSHMDLFSDEFRKPGTGERETSEVEIEEGSGNARSFFRCSFSSSSFCP